MEAEQKKRPVLRYLRIALSAICGILCLLLIVLWVRSYWRFDQFIRISSGRESFALTSGGGRLVFGASNDPTLTSVFNEGWTRRSFLLSEVVKNGGTPVACFPASLSLSRHEFKVLRWFAFRKNPFLMLPPHSGHYYEALVPYWFPVVVATGLASAPWIHWRFSLRTLLIAAILLSLFIGILAISD